jgi:hypothetical protein
MHQTSSQQALAGASSSAGAGTFRRTPSQGRDGDEGRGEQVEAVEVERQRRDGEALLDAALLRVAAALGSGAPLGQ